MIIDGLKSKNCIGLLDRLNGIIGFFGLKIWITDYSGFLDLFLN